MKLETPFIIRELGELFKGWIEWLGENRKVHKVYIPNREKCCKMWDSCFI